jgi:hypothetical protein
MPFRVSYSTRANPVGLILFFSAGIDQFTICSTGATLQAIVIGNTIGHSFEWEQISGSPVTFTTPLDQFSVSYTQTTFEDKTFSFTMDKGTSNQRIDTVTAFGTPTEKITTQPSSTITVVKVVPDIGSIDCRTPTLHLFTNFPDAGGIGIGSCNLIDDSQLYVLPGDCADKLIQFEFQSRSSGMDPWSTDAITIPPNVQFATPVIGRTYRVIASYLDTTISQYVSNPVYIRNRPGNTNIQNASVTDRINISSVQHTQPTLSTYDVVLNTIVFKEPIDNILTAPAHATITTVIVPTYDVLITSLLTKTAPIDNILVSTVPTTVNTVVVTDYTVEDLSSEVIGG